MPRLSLVALVIAGAFAASAASAQDFTATLGFQNTDPKSDNGTLAGGDASVNDNWSVTGSFAYSINPNFSVEVWSGLANFEHEVSIDGLGTVASVKHRPTTLSLNYQFLPESSFRPFVGIGYGWISVSGEKSLGALSGLGISGSNANGLSLTLGADYYVNDSFFLRGDVRKLDFDTEVTVETLGNVGTAQVDPLVYGISAGFRF
jgi:outer membrane protein